MCKKVTNGEIVATEIKGQVTPSSISTVDFKGEVNQYKEALNKKRTLQGQVRDAEDAESKFNNTYGSSSNLTVYKPQPTKTEAEKQDKRVAENFGSTFRSLVNSIERGNDSGKDSGKEIEKKLGKVAVEYMKKIVTVFETREPDQEIDEKATAKLRDEKAKLTENVKRLRRELTDVTETLANLREYVGFAKDLSSIGMPRK